MAQLKRVAIHTVPRSGSTWLGSIFDSSPQVAYRFQPLFSYGHKDQLSPDSAKDEIAGFFEDILLTQDAFTLQKDAIERGLVPKFPKGLTTHLVYKEVRYHHLLCNLMDKDSELRLVAMIRNPMSVIHSWLHAPKEFRREEGWKEEDEWYAAPRKNLNRPEEFNGFLKWKEAAGIFLDLEAKYPERCVVINYKDLLQNPLEVIQSLFLFCELEYTDQTKQFIKNSGSRNVDNAYGVFRKDQTDLAWKGNLPEYMVQTMLKELEGTKLEKYIY